MFNLSVVNIVPEAHKDNINLIAETYGTGKDNLTVKLTDAEGNIYYGCHSWWKPEHYAIFSDEELRNQTIPEELNASLEFLYERLVLDGDAQSNWQSALSELGLTILQENEQAMSI